MRRLLIVLRKQIRRLTHCRDKILRKGAFPLFELFKKKYEGDINFE